MPKLEAMAQLSRPYQIALAGIVLLAGVWLFAFRGHSTGTSGSGSSSPAASSSASSAAASPSSSSSAPVGAGRATSPGQATRVYHGPVPGLEGLTRDIAKAHSTVAASEHSAKQVEGESAEAGAQSAPSASATSSAAASAHHAPATVHHAAATAPHVAATATHVARPTHAANTTVAATHASRPTSSAAAPKVAAGAPASQRSVEAQLAQGKIVVILFWNKNGIDDNAVRRELGSLEAAHGMRSGHSGSAAVEQELKKLDLELSKPIAVHYAEASQVATFGTITRGVQVYLTPTIMIVNGKGQTTVLTGYQDALSIEQAIDEARHA